MSCRMMTEVIPQSMYQMFALQDASGAPGKSDFSKHIFWPNTAWVVIQTVIEIIIMLLKSA
jgi:hypothetical protein